MLLYKGMSQIWDMVWRNLVPTTPGLPASQPATTDEWTDGKYPHSSALCPLLRPLARYSPTTTGTQYKAGKGLADHMIPLPRYSPTSTGIQYKAAQAYHWPLRCSVPAGIAVIAKTYKKLCEVGPSGLKELSLNFLQCRQPSSASF